MPSDTENPIFTDEEAARRHLESIHWPDGPFCPHCGEAERVTRLEGSAHRAGVVQCNSCRQQFTVTIGTVMERSKIPLHKWVYATHLMCSSKKGISAHQLHRMLGISYKAAWFLAHRLREAMADKKPEGLGGGGKVVEADETFIGRLEGREVKAGSSHKMKVMSLVERGGKVRSVKVDEITSEVVTDILRRSAHRTSHLMSDDAKYSVEVGKEFSNHHSVNHSAGEYVRGTVHTNTVEGYFGIFKRGMKGIYQHCGEQHLHRYLAEFDFRYNHRIALGMNDAERALTALEGAKGKRLTYKQPRSAAHE